MNATTIAALYTFCAHYHSGQRSRGYRILCAAKRAWEKKGGIDPRLDFWEMLVKHKEENEVQAIYRRLVRNHKDNV